MRKIGKKKNNAGNKNIGGIIGSVIEVI